jgi:TonB family protein
MKITLHLPPLFIRVLFVLTLSVCAFQAAGQEVRKLLVNPAPIYPEMARQLNLAGTVKIEVVIGPDGEIKETKVIGGHPLLIESALKALHDWKYEKAPTETRLQLEFKFHR